MNMLGGPGLDSSFQLKLGHQPLHHHWNFQHFSLNQHFQPTGNFQLHHQKLLCISHALHLLSTSLFHFHLTMHVVTIFYSPPPNASTAPDAPIPSNSHVGATPMCY